MKDILTQIEFEVLKSRLNSLVKYYEKDLSGVLRYMFKWFIVPPVIQEEVVFLRRNLDNLKNWDKLILSDNNTIEIKEILKYISCYDIRYIKNDKPYQVSFELKKDSNRGDHNITEIGYLWKKYRSVPYNGDVYNHMHHQQDFFDDMYLKPSLEQGIIDEKNLQLLSLFQKIHNLPEIKKWDIQYGIKTQWDCDDEKDIIIDQIRESKLKFSIYEQEYCAKLFSQLEWSTSFFKWWEKLNYIADAIRVFNQDKQYLNDPLLLIDNIFTNNLESFWNKEKNYTFHNFFNNTNNIEIIKGVSIFLPCSCKISSLFLILFVLCSSIGFFKVSTIAIIS